MIISDSRDLIETENRRTGTWVFDGYPDYDEWISQFDFTSRPDMAGLEKVHESHLPVWAEGNAYFNGAATWDKEKNALIEDEDNKVVINLTGGDSPCLHTNLYELLEDFTCRMVDTQLLGKAFEPEQLFEAPDGAAICFDTDYFGEHRSERLLPGPFASNPSGKLLV